MWELFGKAFKTVATGKTQASLGLQSPQTPDAIVRVGRFLYTVSLGWIAVVWYTGYANKRTTPGSGPQLVLPGKPVISGINRPERTPGFAGNVNRGGGSSSNNDIAPGATGSSVRLAVARIALACVGRGNFQYAEVRPMPRSLNAHPCRTDCSGLATLVYKAAQAPDPNGFGYNGSGYTGTLEQNGIRVGRPNVGDLVFWQNPDHVAIVVGTGNDPEIVTFGGPPYPIRSTVQTESKYHATLVGYRSYLTEGNTKTQGTITQVTAAVVQAAKQQTGGKPSSAAPTIPRKR